MTEIIQFPAIDKLEQRILHKVLEQAGDLKSGSGGGTSGGMSDDWKKSVEDRLSGLQADGRALRTDVTTLMVDVATMKENIRHLPTKPWMFAALLMLLTAVGTIVTIVVRFVPHAG